MSLQIPEEVPHPQDGGLFNLHSPWDVVLFLVIPLVIVGLYFFWRKSR